MATYSGERILPEIAADSVSLLQIMSDSAQLTELLSVLARGVMRLWSSYIVSYYVVTPGSVTAHLPCKLG